MDTLKLVKTLDFPRVPGDFLHNMAIGGEEKTKEIAGFEEISRSAARERRED